MPKLDQKTLSYGVLIEGERMSGSGFYIRKNKKLFVITAKHVLYDHRGTPLHEKIYITSYNLPRNQKSYFSLDMNQVSINKKDYIDVAMIHIANVPQDDDSESFDINFVEGVIPEGEMGNLMVPPASIIEPFSNVSVSNDVYILGYPQSLGSEDTKQIEKDKPLIRKGIVAGINKTNTTIILDCPAYFGNSGGIAFEFDQITATEFRYKIIGVVTDYIPFHEHLYSKELNYVNTNLENSGYSVAVPMDTIIEMIDEHS